MIQHELWAKQSLSVLGTIPFRLKRKQMSYKRKAMWQFSFIIQGSSLTTIFFASGRGWRGSVSYSEKHRFVWPCGVLGGGLKAAGEQGQTPSTAGPGGTLCQPRWGHTVEILDPFLIGEVREHGECGKLINLENKVASTSCISPSFLSWGFQKLHYPCFFPSSFSQYSVI